MAKYHIPRKNVTMIFPTLMVIILLEDEKNIQPLSINALKTTSEAPLIVLDGCLRLNHVICGFNQPL